jgi:plasmid stabilization system protein ParE
VHRGLEYLDEAIEEAEAAARWYADRSSSAAAGFAEEIDSAIAAIEQNPEAWPAYDHGARHYLLRRYPFSVVYRVEATPDLDRGGGSRSSAAQVLGITALNKPG